MRILSRGINAGDPSYFGYWSKEEVLIFLKELLESERIGVTHMQRSDARLTLMLQTSLLRPSWLRGQFASFSKMKLPRERELACFVTIGEPPVRT